MRIRILPEAAHDWFAVGAEDPASAADDDVVNLLRGER